MSGVIKSGTNQYTAVESLISESRSSKEFKCLVYIVQGGS